MSRILQGYKVLSDGVDAHKEGYLNIGNICVGLQTTGDTINELRKRFPNIEFTAEKVNKYRMYQNGSVKEIINNTKQCQD